MKTSWLFFTHTLCFLQKVFQTKLGKLSWIHWTCYRGYKSFGSLGLKFLASFTHCKCLCFYRSLSLEGKTKQNLQSTKGPVSVLSSRSTEEIISLRCIKLQTSGCQRTKNCWPALPQWGWLRFKSYLFNMIWPSVFQPKSRNVIEKLGILDKTTYVKH